MIKRDDTTNFTQLRDQLRSYWVDDMRLYGNTGRSGGGASVADINAAISAHRAESDPHSVYLNATEGNALYAPIVHNHDDLYYTKGASDSLFANVGGDTFTGQVYFEADTTHVSPGLGDLLISYQGSTLEGTNWAITPAGYFRATTGSALTVGFGFKDQDGTGLYVQDLNTLSVAVAEVPVLYLTETGMRIGDPSANTHTLDIEGDVWASGSLDFGSLTNTANYIGLAKIGNLGHTGAAAFGHHTADATSYAFRQGASLTSYFNAGAGQYIYFRHGDVTTATLLPDGLRLESAKYLKSTGYVSGWAGSGYNLDTAVTYAGESFLEVDNLSVRGTMKVYELEINQIRATNGTEIVSSAGKIASATGSTWTFEDPNNSNLCAFADNDLVIIQNVDVNSTTVVKRIVRRITSVTGSGVTVTAASGGPADVGVIERGDAVVRFGNSTNVNRQSVVLITSDFAGSPYIDVISGVASWSDWTGGAKTKVRMGHLSGITSNANEYGLIAGNGFADANSWVKFSTTNVTQNNVDSTWKTGGSDFLKLDTANGISIKSFLGEVNPTAGIYGMSWYTNVLGGNRGAYLASFYDSTNASASQRGNTLLMTSYASTVGPSKLHLLAWDEAYSGDTANILLTGKRTNVPVQSSKIEIDADLINLGQGGILLDANQLLLSRPLIFGGGGSASTPILSFDGDTDTGIYLPAANTIGISTNGAERVNLNESSLFTSRLLEVEQGRSTSNVSVFTGRYSTSSGISLTATSWGYASGVLFNAYQADTGISLLASGASKYLGAQYTGDVTRPGMFHWDANSGIFYLSYGEAGLANEANITTWTSILTAGTTGLKVIGNVGFNNTAPIAKPTVTGSRGGNAALASLLTALANYGLIVNSSTA